MNISALALAFASFVVAAPSLAESQDAAPQDSSGNEPAVPLGSKDPCPACTYNVGNKRLNGVLERSFLHSYPLTNMQLRLYNSSGALIAGPFALSPASASGSQSMTQSIPTSVAFGVARAAFSFHTADGYDLTEDLIVQ